MRFSFDVGEKVAIRVGWLSLGPLFTVRPGTLSSAIPLFDALDPSFRIVGPAESPAGRDAGGGGTSVMFAGFSPTIASVVSAGVTAAAPIAGASDAIVGDLRSSGRRGGTMKLFCNPATSRGAADPTGTSGAAARVNGPLGASFF